MGVVFFAPAAADRGPPRDRADAVATAVLRIVADHLTNNWTASIGALHAHVAAYLRNEFRDVARQATTEIRRPDE